MRKKRKKNKEGRKRKRRKEERGKRKERGGKEERYGITLQYGTVRYIYCATVLSQCLYICSGCGSNWQSRLVKKEKRRKANMVERV